MKYRGLELTGDVLTFQGVELCRLSDTKLTATLAGDLTTLVRSIEGLDEFEVAGLVKDAGLWRAHKDD